MPAEIPEREIVQERRDWIAPAFAAATVVFCMLASLVQSAVPSMIGSAALMISAVLGLRRPKTTRRAVRLSAADGMISINGKPALEQEKIANVAFHELPGGEFRLLISDQSLIHRRRGFQKNLQLIFHDRKSVREFVDALGAPVDEEFLRIGIQSLEIWHFIAATLVSMLGFVLIAGSGKSLWFAGLALILTSVFISVLARASIAVGRDGVHIERPYLKRFVPLGDIRSVDEVHDTLSLTLRSGKRVRVKVIQPGVVVLLRSKIMQAMDKRNLNAVADSIPRELERGERPIHEWLAAVRLISSTSVGKYRDAATSAADLYRLLDDQNAAPTLRAASAVGLRVLDPEHAAERIASLAAHTANPRLRVALECVAKDAELEECFESLVAEERASSRT